MCGVRYLHSATQIAFKTASDTDSLQTIQERENCLVYCNLQIWLKEKKDTNSAGSPQILKNLTSKRKCDLEPCKSIYLSFIGRFSFKRKRFPSFLILPISVLLRSRLNNRGEYLSYRDPEWWIQSNNTPWRNPYARWGNENGTSLYEERYIRPEFVVSVDTSNPNIRRLLEDGLDMAEDMIREKASFAIEVR